MGNPYTDVRVPPGNVLLGTWRVACTNGTVRMYEDFHTKEEAEFWAQAIRDGKWKPLEQEATKELRERIEQDNE